MISKILNMIFALFILVVAIYPMAKILDNTQDELLENVEKDNPSAKQTVFLLNIIRPSNIVIMTIIAITVGLFIIIMRPK